MYKILCFLCFFSISFCSTNFEVDAFNYSIQNLEFQNSVYGIKLIKSQNSFEYNFSWLPTKKLLINTKIINPSSNSNDNKLYYSANIALFVLKNNIIGIGINSLRFDNEYNFKKWNNYSFVNEFKFYKWNINTTFAYNFNQNFSFTNFSIYLHKNIHKNFNAGFGVNISKFSNLITNIYFGIKYTL